MSGVSVYGVADRDGLRTIAPMRLFAFATLLLIAGCSDEAESRGPVESLRPPGSGWGCFRDRVPSLSMCRRPADCEAARVSYASEKDRTGEAYDLTPCTTRDAVSCFTAYFVVAQRSGFVCLETMTECQRIADFAKTSADYRDASDCGSW